MLCTLLQSSFLPFYGHSTGICIAWTIGGIPSLLCDLLMSVKLALQSYAHVDLYSLFTAATFQRYLSAQISVINLSYNDPPVSS
jgi:hypothetical protein